MPGSHLAVQWESDGSGFFKKQDWGCRGSQDSKDAHYKPKPADTEA